MLRILSLGSDIISGVSEFVVLSEGSFKGPLQRWLQGSEPVTGGQESFIASGMY